MKMFEQYFGQWVVKKRWAILLATALLSASAIYGAQFLSFENNNRIFFSEDNPQLKAFEAMERTYAKNENVMFVLAPKDGQVFSRATLAAIEDLTEQSWQMPFSSRVDSITNFQHSYAEDDDLVVADMVSTAQILSETELAEIKQTVLSEPLLVNRVIAPDGAVTGVFVTIQKQDKADDEVQQIARFSRELAAEFRANYPEIDLYLGGSVMFNTAFMEVSMEDMATLVPLMYLALLLVMAYLLRSVTGTLATLIVISISMAGSLGLAGWAGIALSPPSVNSPTIVLTLAVAHCIHILVSMFMQMREGKIKFEAIAESLRINLQPVILTSVTTTIGFLSMNFSDAPPFRDLGNIVAMGSVIAMLLALFTLPALMAVLPVRVPRARESEKNAFMDRFGAFVVRRSRWLMHGVMVLVVGTTLGINKISLDDNFVKYFDERYEIRQVADYTQDNLTGLDAIEYSLSAGETAAINDPAYLEKIEAFANWYRAQPKVAHVNVITDIVKRLNRNLHGDDPDYHRIPEDRELAAQYMLMYEMSLPYGLDLNNQINIDKSATRMIVTLKKATSKELREIDIRARQWLKQNAPQHMFTYGASMSLMFAHISERNITQMLTGTILALVLISGILMISLRSVKVGLISLVPNLLPAAMAFGVWGHMVGEVGLTIAVVGSLTLGIIVDDTVHFLSKYLRARRELGLPSSDAIRYSFSSVGKALFVTTVVLVVGFGILALSGFKLNADTGLLTAIVIALALVTDFLLLPGLLMKFDRPIMKIAQKPVLATDELSMATRA